MTHFIPQQGGYHCSHFRDGETEAPRGQILCPQSLMKNSKWQHSFEPRPRGSTLTISPAGSRALPSVVMEAASAFGDGGAIWGWEGLPRGGWDPGQTGERWALPGGWLGGFQTLLKSPSGTGATPKKLTTQV